MKHIIIALLIGALLFSFLGLYFKNSDIFIADNTSTSTIVNTSGLSQIGILLNDSSSEDKNDFISTITETLADTAKIHSVDSLSDEDIQVDYAKRLISEGISCLILEPVSTNSYQTILSLTAEKNIPLIIYEKDISISDLKINASLYSVHLGEEVTLEMIADTIANYWRAYEDQIDFFKTDGKLNIATVSKISFKDSGQAAELISLLKERDCKAVHVRDTVTQSLDYNLEQALDNDFGANAEMILFTNSSDAVKAAQYYNDPSEYPSGKAGKISLVVWDMDHNTYELYQNGEILFCSDNNGYVLGLMTGKIINSIFQDKVPSANSLNAYIYDNGHSFECNPLTYRGTIPDEE